MTSRGTRDLREVGRTKEVKKTRLTEDVESSPLRPKTKNKTVVKENRAGKKEDGNDRDSLDQKRGAAGRKARAGKKKQNFHSGGES